MGRGDIRTKKGKRNSGSYGNSRPQRTKKTAVIVEKAEKLAPVEKKKTAKKTKAAEAAE
jgi:30S ribosomal protein S31